MDFPYLIYRDKLGESIRVNDFKKGVKWFHLLIDVPISAALIARIKMRLSTYLRSWRGKESLQCGV
jgi:hypothetical protein